MEVKTIKKVNLLSDRQTGKRPVKPAGEMIPKIGTTKNTQLDRWENRSSVDKNLNT